MFNTKILIVEDEIIEANGIQLSLENVGYTVCGIAATGEEAIQKVNLLEPDLIIMDIFLKGSMDGIEAAALIKEDFNIPVIYLTAHSDDDALKRAKVTIPYGFIIKPYNKRELKNTIELALYKHELENKLKIEEEKQRLSDIIDFLPDATFAIDLGGKVIAWNRAIEDMTGILKEDILGKGDYEYSIPWYGERRPILIDLIDDDDSKFSLKYQNLHKKGRTVYAEVYVPEIYGGKGAHIWVSASPLLDTNGWQYGAIESIRDINDLKKALIGLKESEEKFKMVVETAAEGIGILDKKGTILDINQKALDMSGFSRDELIGANFTKFIPLIKLDMKSILTTFKNILKGNKALAQDLTMINRRGEEVSFVVNLTPLKKGKETIGISFIMEDITERKRSEDRIKKALKEKETLLKEIHHRVKNNLQIISSLLVLQKDYVKNDPTAVNVLGESQNRVLSMAMIHEMLYQSKDLNHINFSDYIEKLVFNLFSSYGKRNRITPVINVDDVLLNIETAVPLGLIISELVSNSLKYAYNDTTGEILISLHPHENELELVISDYGVGLPEDLDFRNTTSSFGLKLVNLLISQLDGDIELDRSEGTKFTVKFKELEYRERF
ncbi:MAG: two-component response regulator [Methanobacterium sp. PtaU1.Bin242]|nr:MAG: two-component response regulator [Methanobacterium sp. PtaU1.Bin242]